MTATQVDGVEVVADEPTAFGMRDASGNLVYQKQTRTLLLADGRTLYGCLHCDYTRENRNAIRPHLKAHSGRGAAKNDQPAANLTLADLLARLEQLDKVTAERDAWKTRAKTAEKKLTTLRNALGGNK